MEEADPTTGGEAECLVAVEELSLASEDREEVRGS